MTSQPFVAPRSGVTRSLVGQKAVMAVTGVILFLFVVAHLLGNQTLLEEPAAFDAYAERLGARGGRLHRGDGRARAAPLPRHVERAADPRAQPAADRGLAPRRRGGHRGADRGCVHLHSGGGARRHATLTMELRSRIPDGPLE